MATAIKLPELGDGIESGDVLEVLVKVGDVIKDGQDIVEIETDKATVPVPSSAAGKVTKILVKQGDTVPIGGALIEIEAVGAAAASAPAEAPAKPVEQVPPKTEPAEQKPAAVVAAAAPKAEPAPAPVKQPEPAAQPVAAQKITPSAPAPKSPAPSNNPPAAPPAAPPVQPIAAPASLTNADEIIPAGPAIRRLAREVGVDLGVVSGSGEGGRITREDVLAVVRQTSQAVRGSSSSSTAIAETSNAAPSAAAVLTTAQPSGTATASDDYGPIRVERMEKIRKTIANKMHQSWSTVPRVTNFDDADITDLEYLRQSSKEDYAAQGLKLTTMPFLIKAVATALKHHPSINATIDMENSQLIYKEYVNVGIAVDTDSGLMVPVLRNTDKMGIPEITRTLAEMAGKVRGGKVVVNDMRGGTFTISNLGAIGGQYSTPIVNVPEVAILLVGRSRKLPVVMPDDSIKARLMMPLSLSYDHRLVDGGIAARFLNDIIGYLESPSRLLLAL